MYPRLNVTDDERLCYSRRRLRAISALRNGGMNPIAFGLHKDYRIPDVRGKVYLLRHPSGLYAFRTLAELHRYAAVCQVWRAQPRFTWAMYLQGPPPPEAYKAACAWPECGEATIDVLEGQCWCRAHALIYEQMLLGSGTRVS